MSSPVDITSTSHGVCNIRLDRPERHNAFNAVLIGELSQRLADIEHDPRVRIVTLTGSGASFSSGADLEWMRTAADYDEADNQADALQLAELMRRWFELSKPTIARINGPAYGGALGLIAGSDIAIAVDSAQFAFSEVRLGLIPAVISPYIVRAIGERQSRRLFLSAAPFSAHEAQRLGLIHVVVPETDLDDSVQQQIKHLLSAGPEALQACKQLLHQLTSEGLDDLALAELIAQIRVSEEAQEGLRAFLEKRRPDWLPD